MDIRLKQFEIESITKHFKDIFLPDDKLWLFGSRANPTKKGGDIDLYIETNMSPDIADNARWNLINRICDSIGDQKIDVVLNLLQSNSQQVIYTKAKTEGVQLV